MNARPDDWEAQKIYDKIPRWVDNEPVDFDDVNAVSEGIDWLLGQLKIRPKLGLPDKMPIWQEKNRFLLADDLNCWIAGLTFISAHLGTALSVWFSGQSYQGGRGIPLFVADESLQADHLNQISDCIRQAFRIVFGLPLGPTPLSGWDDDPLSL